MTVYCATCNTGFTIDYEKCPACKHQRRVAKARPKARFKISKSKRRRIHERDKHACLSCGSQDDLTVDHILPLSAGGSNAYSNLQTLCGKCNRLKGHRHIDLRFDGGNSAVLEELKNS